MGVATHGRNFLEVTPVVLNNIVHVAPFLETTEATREGDLTQDVEHEVLHPAEQVQIIGLVSKFLIQTLEEVFHS